MTDTAIALQDMLTNAGITAQDQVDVYRNAISGYDCGYINFDDLTSGAAFVRVHSAADGGGDTTVVRIDQIALIRKHPARR
jgi:hypothetical protein